MSPAHGSRYTQAMRKQATVAAIAAVLLLALTGCGEETAIPAGTPDTASVKEAAPLVAEDVEEAEVGSDAAYLTLLREALDRNGAGNIPDATDSQLIEAGNTACEQMAAGAGILEVRVIENETETEVGFVDSGMIAGAASEHLCPEFAPAD